MHNLLISVQANGTYVANMAVPEEGGWRAFFIQVSALTYCALSFIDLRPLLLLILEGWRD